MRTREYPGKGVSNDFDNAIAVQTGETFHKCGKAAPLLSEERNKSRPGKAHVEE